MRKLKRPEKTKKNGRRPEIRLKDVNDLVVAAFKDVECELEDGFSIRVKKVTMNGRHAVLRLHLFQEGKVVYKAMFRADFREEG